MHCTSVNPWTVRRAARATLGGVTTEPGAAPALAPAPAAAVITRGLGKRYGEVTALADLDLIVPERSVVGFLGPNGAGKTTAMKLLVGLARPSSGSATVVGLDVRTQSAEVRSRIGYLAQEPRFYEHLSARETLRFVARFFYTGPEAAVEERIDALLTLVGLQAKADRPIRGFSGGERQRLGIAQASVNEPDLLLMDEPAASLDPAGRQAVLEIIGRLREHTTVFFSTHILDDVQRVADRVAILDRGRLVAYDETPALLAGDGATTFELALRGPLAAVEAALAAEPWAEAVERGGDAPMRTAAVEPGRHEPGSASDGALESTLYVRAHDVAAAEARLLPVALGVPGTIVTRYQRRSFELEEVFLRLVDGAREQRKTTRGDHVSDATDADRDAGTASRARRGPG